jgi:hypothetical protein
MTHREKRCNHCSVRYYYQSSGHGCDSRLNDPSYCPGCRDVILKALDSVPPRVKKISVEIFDPPFDLVKQWFEENQAQIAERRANGELVAERILPGFIDMEDMTNKHIQGFVGGRGSYQGRTFIISFWTKKGKSEVTELQEVDLVTGDSIPWVDLR